MAKTKVLVVDDSSLTRALFEKALVEGGFDVVTASDGFEGLEKFKIESPGIILTDLMMPKLDGIEMAKNIRKINKKVPILLISSEFNKANKERAEKVGINDYVFKYFEKKELIKKLEELL